MKHKILMAVAFMTVSSCMKLKKKEEESPKPVAQVQTQEVKVEKPFVNERTELDYEYEISEDEKALPAVRFLASADWPAEILMVKKDEKEEQKLIHFDDKGEWKDFLTAQNKVSYKFYSKLSNQSILLGEVEVLPILDLKITEDLNLAEKYKLNSKTKVIYISNLEISEQKHLFLNDYSGQVVIQNITSSGGIIQSFPLDARATLDQNGKSGGQIVLSVLAGTGLLSVVMKGENGGNGSSAKEPDITKKGLPGAPGNSAEFKPAQCNPNFLESTTEPFCGNLPYDCVKTPTDGISGGRGLNGFSGNNGKVGGNSGSLSLYNESDSLKVSISTLPGSFGNGSPGGRGGVGGDGGYAGDGANNDLQTYLKKMGFPTQGFLGHAGVVKTCPAAKPGGTGVEGEVGELGQKGEPGMNQLSCLYLHDQKVKCIND